MAILRELWSEEITDDQVLFTYQHVDFRERLEQTCKLTHENLRKVQVKQKAYYHRRARSRMFKVADKVLLLLPIASNKLLLQRNGPFEVVNIFNGLPN